MLSGEIYKRVMAVVKAKVKEAQDSYDLGVENLDARHDQDVKDLRANLSRDKENLADKLVNDITKKFL